MNYEEALEYISNINWKWSIPGLERIRILMDKLGNPQDGLKFIHVAGTNGKGSTCAFLSHILVKSGYKVGLFTSPFIEVFNERMQINNENISNEELAEITTYIQPFADSMEDPPTEFELNTAIGFVYFARNNCDIVILEVGMGGELDSTNIIKSPELAIITTISLDHTQYLGDTVTKIAETKSGIIKPGTNVVVYNQDQSVMRVIKKKCKDEGAGFYVSEPNRMELVSSNIERQVFSHPDFGNLAASLIGRYQMENIAVVLKAVEVLRKRGYNISSGSVLQGLEATRWPGRFEVIHHDPFFIVDGGHNPQGIKATTDSLKAVFHDEKLIIIFGVLADKDYMQMLGEILPIAREVLTVTPPSARALDSAETAKLIEEQGVTAKSFEKIGDAIDCAMLDSAGITPICALGSLYMVGDVKKYVNERFYK